MLILIDAQPNHKTDVIDFSHRLEMARLGAQARPKIHADKLPLQRQVRNHDLASIQELKQFYPNTELFLLMGDDTFATLERWDNIEELLQLLSFGVARRSGSHEITKAELRHRFGRLAPVLRYETLTMPLVGISSSLIRKAVGISAKVEGLPPAVSEYIKNNRLYDSARAVY